MMISEEKKVELFEKMLDLEHKAEEQDRINEKYPHSYSDKYFHECNGAFEMLQTLGLSSEYIQWAIGK